jgi:hypothetical protein
MSSATALKMDEEQIKNTYLQAVKDLTAGGRITDSGRHYMSIIDTIFDATGLDALEFQGVVEAATKERFGDDYTKENREYITSSLRSFVKSPGSPYTSTKEGRFSVIRRK